MLSLLLLLICIALLHQKVEDITELTDKHKQEQERSFHIVRIIILYPLNISALGHVFVREGWGVTR